MKHFCIILAFFFAAFKCSEIKAQDTTFSRKNVVYIEMGALLYDYGNNKRGAEGALFKIGTVLLSNKNLGLGIEVGNVSRLNIKDSCSFELKNIETNQIHEKYGELSVSQANVVYFAIGPEFRLNDGLFSFSFGLKLGLGSLVFPKNIYGESSAIFPEKSIIYPYSTFMKKHDYQLHYKNEFTSLLVYSIPLRAQFNLGSKKNTAICLNSQMLVTRGHLSTDLSVYENGSEVYQKNNVGTSFGKIVHSTLWTVGAGMLFRF